jgi:hypothetical protein
MRTYLIGILYHEPKFWRLRQAGLVEDYESSVGIFIDAETEIEALAWAEEVALRLMRHVNQDPAIGWKEFGYYCWVEPKPDECPWSHCLAFFQRVRVGDHPDYSRMDTQAFERWLKVRGSA